MLNQPTMERLQAMKLHGMAQAFREQYESADSSQLSFEERFGLLVDCQWTWKENRALTRRLQLAKFKERGLIEDIDYQHPRGLDRRLMRTLASSDWVRQHQNLLLIGPPESAKAGWPAHWPIRLAAMDSLPSIKEWLNCSATWPWPAPMAALVRC
jgi:DNA replication protein DnaC